MMDPIPMPRSPFSVQSNKVRSWLQTDEAAAKLHPHQIAAVMSVDNQFMTSTNRIALVVLPTGCGKSGVAVLVPYVINASKVLVITPSLAISEQLYNDFCGSERKDSFLLKREMIKAKHFDDWTPKGVQISPYLAVGKCLLFDLVVANAQKFSTTSKHVAIAHFPSDHFDLVIIDEAHHYPAPTWKKIVQHFASTKCLFLTATPYRQGEYILSIPPCFELKKDVAIRERIIRKDDFQEAGYNTQPHPGISCLIHECLDNHDKQDTAYHHQAMVLTPTIIEADSFVQEYCATYPDETCQAYHGKTKNKPQVFESFKEGKTRVLVIAGKLLEGFDHKNVSVVGIARKVSRKSKVLFTQFVGRAVRKLHENDPVTAMVVSHVTYEQKQNFYTFEDVPDDNDDPEDDPNEDDKEEAAVDEPMETA